MASVFSHAALLISLLTPPAIFAQNAAPAPAAQKRVPTVAASAQNASPMPSDPAAILALAAKVNGLDGPGVQPWHIKASYQTFDSDGDPEDSGTYEEFWVSAKKYKRSYASTNFTQTDFATDRGLYRSGNQNWPGLVEMKVRTDLIQPMPSDMNLHDFKLEKSDRSFGQVQLQCVTLRPKKSNITIQVIGYPDTFPHYCFDRNEPMLRFDSQGSGQYDTLYNDIILFQGRYLARDIRVTNQGKPRLTLHVETIENLSAINESDFTAASDAVGPLGGKITATSGMMMGLLLKTVYPHYPESARRARVQGKVVVQVTIGKDGHVTTVQAISGPPMLQRAAIECVRKWEFRPFLILGEPVEVESKFEVLFALGG